MRVLLDTHSFLWFIEGSQNLSEVARALIEDPGSELVISTASLWEMAVKCSLGKLSLAEPFGVLIPRQLALTGVEVLRIEIPHVSAVATLPFHHRDPFDRLLVAQCQVERLPIVSKDSSFDPYGIDRRW